MLRLPRGDSLQARQWYDNGLNQNEWRSDRARLVGDPALQSF